MSLNVDGAVKSRYSEAAGKREAALCCPVDYDPKYLKVIPKENIERDYGCGDPSQYVKEGETVLDLGSGSGKICFIAAQVVGPKGRVLGVDMNDDMLQLAEQGARTVGEQIGYHNVSFLKGKIQDLSLNRGSLDRYLKSQPVISEEDLTRTEEWVARERSERPLVADDSIDVVVSNCVLNLVGDREKRVMFEEIFRVLKRGGRAVISDIVADEPVPEHLKADAELWSGCISGAFEENAFVEAFAQAGFYGVEVVKRDERPWQTVEGIEFRSVTVVAYKGKEGACWEHNEAVIYKGPYSAIEDDDGHRFVRGVRTAVCRKTFEIVSRAPYREHFYLVPPRVAIDKKNAQPFRCMTGKDRRDPRQTKGQDYRATTEASGSCC